MFCSSIKFLWSSRKMFTSSSAKRLLSSDVRLWICIAKYVFKYLFFNFLVPNEFAGCLSYCLLFIICFAFNPNKWASKKFWVSELDSNRDSRFEFQIVFFFFLWVLERDSFVSGGQVKTAHHAQLNLLINNYAARCWVFSVAIKVLNWSPACEMEPCIEMHELYTFASVIAQCFRFLSLRYSFLIYANSFWLRDRPIFQMHMCVFACLIFGIAALSLDWRRSIVGLVFDLQYFELRPIVKLL